MRPHRHLFAAFVLPVLLVAAVACGDDDDDPPETTSTTASTSTTALEDDTTDTSEDDMEAEDMEASVECLDDTYQTTCDTFSVDPRTDLPAQVDVAIPLPDGVVENWLIAQCATEVRETATEWMDACQIQTVSPLSAPAGSIIGLPVTRMMDTRAAGAVDCGAAPCEIAVIDPAAGAIAASPITFAG